MYRDSGKCKLCGKDKVKVTSCKYGWYCDYCLRIHEDAQRLYGEETTRVQDSNHPQEGQKD